MTQHAPRAGQGGARTPVKVTTICCGTKVNAQDTIQVDVESWKAKIKSLFLGKLPQEIPSL